VTGDGTGITNLCSAFDILGVAGDKAGCVLVGCHCGQVFQRCGFQEFRFVTGRRGCSTKYVHHKLGAAVALCA
jgi:hypothetical protein